MTANKLEPNWHSIQKQKSYLSTKSKLIIEYNFCAPLFQLLRIKHCAKKHQEPTFTL